MTATKSITIKIEYQNSHLDVHFVARPICPSAQIFAEIAGTKTLTKNTLDHIKRLGYNVKIMQDVKTLVDIE